MNEEIKQLIKNEAEKFAYSRIKDKNRQPDNDIFFAAKECGIEIGNLILSKWQEAERWRKVGEHRPAVDEHLMYSYTCLVRLEFGAYAIAVYHSCGAWMESGTEEYLDTVIEWKPIS